MKKVLLHKYLLLMVLLLQGISLFAQKEANIWYFGDSAGLDFNTNPPTALTNSVISALEGSSSIADRNGNLLFYSDGETVWNKNHQIMTNGEGLLGSSSSPHGALIIKQPCFDSIFFIFTAGSLTSNNGVCYSIIDMRLSQQLGAVTTKNIKLVSYSLEKIAAIGHSNKKDIWISIPAYHNDIIYTFLLTHEGINKNVVFNRIGQNLEYFYTGQIKYSNDASKLAFTTYSSFGTIILDFNNSTGVLSNTRIISGYAGYGLEFSPNSQYLYVQGYKNLYQCIIPSSSTTFKNSCFKIDSLNTNWGSLQLAPDKKIYSASRDSNYLNCINYPDNNLSACGFVNKAIDLKSKLCMMGLPSFYQNSFTKITYGNLPTVNLGNDTTFCDNSTLLLKVPSNYQSYLWNDLSTADSLLVSKEGLYTVTVNDSGCMAQDEIKVSYLITPNVNLGNDTSFCEGVPFYLKATNSQTNYLWSNFSTDSIIKITQSGTYWVKAYNACGTSFDTTEIKVEACNCYIYVPNAFTPDGNGLNEVFLPVSNCKITNYQLIILNRWGVKIFESNNPNIGWNGKLNEILQSNDVYVYQIQADLIDNFIGTNKKQVSLKGNVTLLN